jgi:predicted amidohydrolase
VRTAERSPSVKIALLQMEMDLDENSNLQKALGMIRSASDRGANIVCLPELFLSQYFPQRKGAKTEPRTIPGTETDVLSQAASDNKVVVVAGSIYEIDGADRFNTCVVFDSDGRLLGKYRKVHLPEDPSFYEQDYFKPGNKFEVFSTSRGKVGALICFDQWYPEAARVNKLLGADFIFYPTAIGTVDGIEQSEGSWQRAWENVQVGHAISNSVIVAAANRVGKEGAMKFWGGSFISDQFGNVLVRGDDREGIFLAECNLDLGSDIESGWGFLKNRRPSTYKKIVES